MNAIVAVRFLEPVNLSSISSLGEAREVIVADPRARHTVGTYDLIVETHPLGLKIRSKHENKDGTRLNHSVIVPFANIASVTEGYFGESKPADPPNPGPWGK